MSAGVITEGRTAIGIEVGSTRIKACLVDSADPSTVLATGSHQWESELVDGFWSYRMADVWVGIQRALEALCAEAESRFGVRPARIARMGVSAMMHGYLALDGEGELLVPFRTWRNTHTGAAATELSELFGVNIPLRWSVAHVRQAMRDGEAHVSHIDSLTTLAGYVHRRLTGRNILGVGDASGMFPIDPRTGDFDAGLLARFDALMPGFDLRAKLPDVRAAGRPAGTLTADGARLLDPTGRLEPGALLCPPEGDAGTGMVATNAIAPRTASISVGTSVFAMVVLERPLTRAQRNVDVVCTPDGAPVAMVHCNNGASELGAWASVFEDFARLSGAEVSTDAVYGTLFDAAARAREDAGGIIAINTVAGEPILGLERGMPLIVRSPESILSLGNLMRAHLYSTFAALAIGLEVLEDEYVVIDRFSAQGGLFRTSEVAQRLLASMIGTSVSVGEAASEGGAWGMAVLAASPDGSTSLSSFLDNVVFAGAPATSIGPVGATTAGFRRYVERYRCALKVERVAVAALAGR